MPLAFSLAEDLKVVEGLVPQIGGAAPVTSDYVSCKNLQKLFAVIHYNQGDATDVTWRVLRDISVAGGASVAIANVVPIWSNLNCAASDTLVRRTNAVNYASGVAQTHKIIVFQIDPAALGLTAGGVPYDCIAVGSVGNIAATSTVEIMFYGLPRYPGPVAMQPSIIID
ncbi:MAG: hypothetical protein FJZ90_00030 [Chloroflexi bacterium]|nr:hypothetical protein [Chloroflexota bacterium]